MKTKPFYQLRGTFYRSQDDLTDLVEINEIFEDDILIKARKAVFSRYQSFVDVLCEYKGVAYQSHEQAEELLMDYTNSYKREFLFGNPDVELDIDFDKGLHIYLIIDPTDSFTTKEGELIYNNKLLIHYLDNREVDLKDTVFGMLQNELLYFKLNNIDTRNIEVGYDISDIFEEEYIAQILRTPIDFGQIFKRKRLLFE